MIGNRLSTFAGQPSALPARPMPAQGTAMRPIGQPAFMGPPVSAPPVGQPGFMGPPVGGVMPTWGQGIPPIARSPMAYSMPGATGTAIPNQLPTNNSLVSNGLRRYLGVAR